MKADDRQKVAAFIAKATAAVNVDLVRQPRIIEEFKALTADEIVAFTLIRARQDFKNRGPDAFDYGFAMGQLLVAECDLHAPGDMVRKARDEIAGLYSGLRGKK